MHGLLAALDALGDLDLALAREQGHRAHLAQVHAHGVVGLVEGARGEVELGALLASSAFSRNFCSESTTSMPIDPNMEKMSSSSSDELISDGQHVVHLLVEEVALLLAHRDELPDLVVLFFDRQRHSLCFLSPCADALVAAKSQARHLAAPARSSRAAARLGASPVARRRGSSGSPPCAPSSGRRRSSRTHSSGRRRSIGGGLDRDLATAAAARPRRASPRARPQRRPARPRRAQRPARRAAGPPARRPSRSAPPARRAPPRRPRRPASTSASSQRSAGSRPGLRDRRRRARPPRRRPPRLPAPAGERAPQLLAAAAALVEPAALDDRAAARPRAPPRSRSARAPGSSAFRYARLARGRARVVLGRGARGSATPWTSGASSSRSR